MELTSRTDQDVPARSERFRELPESVRLDETVATHETRPVPDPAGGRDTERDFMLRNAAG